jgi:hypothetical protein
MKTKSLIAFLIFTGSLYSQKDVSRLFLRDSSLNANFTRIYSSYALTFKSPLCCDADTIYVNVLSDSIDIDKRTLHLFCYFPKNINPVNSTMLLNYEDGSNEILYPPGFPDENNYVEYYIASRQWNAIASKKVKSITFRGIGTFKVKDKSFFIDFYKKVL